LWLLIDMNAPPDIAHHAHDAGLDASLDLINTLELTDGQPDDQLATPDAAVAFISGHGLAHEADLRAQARREGDPWLQRVHETRSALRELWDAQVEGRMPGERSLRTLNAILECGPRVELRATIAGVEVTHRHRDDDPTGEALARTATPLVEAISAGEGQRFRICANDGCRWVFEDTSRAGQRRWCDMATCGNRAKARRFRSRRRDAGGDSEGTGPAPSDA
jgi:predicted RNA-binding Zn ribbon-like protein